MKNHRKKHPYCEYCQRSEKVDVHHIISVKEAPHMADDPDNLMTLCRKPACHHIIGHNGNWQTSNPNAVEICKQNRKYKQGNLL